MKLALILPFVLLLGLVIGGWAPKEQLRALQAERKTYEARLAELERGGRMDALTRMIQIPERAQAPAKTPSGETKPTEPAAPSDAGTDAPPDSQTPHATATDVTPPDTDRRSRRESFNPEDLRARIDEAKALWLTRVEVARAQWADRLQLDAAGTALFDDALNTMNENLYHAMQRIADELTAKETLTPEDGTRAFHEMTAAMVQAYDDLGALVPEAQRGETARMELTDFIDPAVAEPLIAVQDKLENLSRAPERDRRRGPRLFR